MAGLPGELEAKAQELLKKWETEEKTETLSLTRDQFFWLGRAIHIFQAHERTMRLSASDGDRIYTEAMVRYIMKQFEKKED